MFELGALLLSAFILFMFGLSTISLICIGAIIILSFILLNTIAFIFKFAFWIILAMIIYYLFFNKERDQP
ncbi:hypothetical protein [Psychromonas sp. MME2]|uniref:hypothetical protein n=1 Tax=unclassified Psychromonas TaxID=2614957 RepID=UPI00339CD070